MMSRLAFFFFFSQIGTKQWRYYDFGPKVVPPLVCIPGTAGTADVYYKQIMSLSMKVLSLILWSLYHIHYVM
jgi:pimeloyl-ACP methyl ester carboxylesterase